MRRSYILILLLVAVLVVGGVFYLEYHHRQELSKVQNACIILISKQEMKLRLIDYKGQEIFCAPVATGKNVGDKRKQGDMRTPEGVSRCPIYNRLRTGNMILVMEREK